MMRTLLRHMLPAVLLLCPFLPAHDATASASLDQMQLSTVRIVCKTDQGAIGSGSGFVVANDRVSYIVTNAHVVLCGGDNGNVIALVVAGDAGQSFPANVVSGNPDKDLAIISVPLTLGRPAVTLADTSNLTIGDSVIAIGFPGVADDLVDTDEVTVPTVTKGNIERIVTDSSGMRWIQHSASINHGNSGGPLFDTEGDVIGINSRAPSADVVTNDDGKVGDEVESVDSSIAASIDIGEMLQPLRAQGIIYHMAEPGLGQWTILALGAVGVGLVAGLGAAAIILLRRKRTLTSQKPTSQKPGQPQPSRKGWVRALEGSLKGMEAQIGAVLVIGRDPQQAQFVFPPSDEKVSRRHCEIRYDARDGYFELRDCGSTNGTFVTEEGKPARRLAANVAERLPPGRTLLIGSPRNVLLLECM